VQSISVRSLDLFHILNVRHRRFPSCRNVTVYISSLEKPSLSFFPSMSLQNHLDTLFHRPYFIISEKPKTTNDDLAPAPNADCYKMNHTRRGIAVIFNHVNFSMPECPKRDGSDKDRDDLTELLVELDFEVLRYDDPPFRQVARALEQGTKSVVNLFLRQQAQLQYPRWITVTQIAL
jgi:hypothetical protein